MRSIPILIVGASGLGRLALDAAVAVGQKVAGWVDANPALWGTMVNGFPVWGPVSGWKRYEAQLGPCDAVLAVGDGAVRQQYAILLREAGVHLETIIHPRAYVAPSTSVGDGVLVAAGSHVGPEGSLGAGVVINMGVTIGHSSTIEPFVTVGLGVKLAGRNHVENGVYVPAGVVVSAGTRLTTEHTLQMGEIIHGA